MVRQSKEEDENQIKEDIRDIRNRTDKIMGDIHNINRLLVLENSQKIRQDLSNLVEGMPKRAAILLLTAEYIDGEDLSKQINIDKRNLNKFLNPFLEKGYVSEMKSGRKKLFKRHENIELTGFDKSDVFCKLIKEWEASKSVS